MAGSLKALVAAAVLAGAAGCAYQDPLHLPDPYPRQRLGGYGYYDPYYGGGSSGYYSRYYGYGSDPYYYDRVAPAYGYYYPYPRYPLVYCVDANRDGRCDRKRHDRDHDQDGDHDDHDRDLDGRGQDRDGAGPRRDRDREGRFVPRDGRHDPERFVPGSRQLERRAPREGARSPGAAGMVPRAVPTPLKPAPIAPRDIPRARDAGPAVAPAPRSRAADRPQRELRPSAEPAQKPLR